MTIAKSTFDTSFDDDAALLHWYMQMGVDEAIGEVPVDRLAPSPERKPEATGERPAGPAREERGSPPAIRERPAVAADGVPASNNEIVADAREVAAKADSIEALFEALLEFEGCALKKTAMNLVLSDGSPDAHLMLIGEGPGADEDRQGKPFVGRSGLLLDKMLNAIGLDRHAQEPERGAFISNTVFWRPPGNRKPTPAETEICMPFILRAIDLANPRMIVCLGATPMQRLCNTSDGILRWRGRWRSYKVNGRDVPLMPTLHPAYLLRQPAQKALCWRDMLDVRRRLDELSD